LYPENHNLQSNAQNEEAILAPKKKAKAIYRKLFQTYQPKEISKWCRYA
jgi:hypothetical protein